MAKLAILRNRLVTSLVGVSMIAALAGCATPGNEPEEETAVSQLTLDEAKAITIEHRTEIAAFLPEGVASEVRAATESNALIPCKADDEYVWPGSYIAVIDGEVDQAAVVDAIATEWESRDDWFVERTKSETGDDRVKLTSTDGSYFAVGFHVDGTEFWVDSYSPCFALPGGFVYGTEY